MEQLEWDWLNQSNKKEGILTELKPIIESVIKEFNPSVIITSPEIAVILDETDLFYIISSDDIILNENGDELTYIVMDTEFEDDVKCEVFLSRKIESNLVLFIDDKNVLCELKINIGKYGTIRTN